MPAGEPVLLRWARTYSHWLHRSAHLVLCGALAVAVVGAVLAARLEIRGGFSALLPPQQRSVQDLEAIQRRVQLFGSMYLIVESDDDSARQAAAGDLRDRLRALESPLVGSVETSQAEAARFLYDQRFLLIERDDLLRGRDALREYIQRARERASPFFIDLENDEEKQERERALDDLKRRLAAAEHRRDLATSAYTSRDGRLQLIVLRTTFAAADTTRGGRLVELIRAPIRAVAAAHHVQVGVTGDVITNVQERDSIAQGMAWAAVLTVFLVLVSLVLYYRTIHAVWVTLLGLAVGSLATFGIAEIVIGHLNLATAFLAAIVVGNGINPNLILMARYREELRRCPHSPETLARAIAGALRGTATASITASVAYASLIVTEFRGFRDFGVIASFGMVFCWVAAFTVVPALLIVLFRWRSSSWARPETWGVALGRLLPQRPWPVLVAGGLALAGFGAVVVHFVSDDPIEEDFRNLRSDSPAIRVNRSWNDRVKAEFESPPNRHAADRFIIGLQSAAEAKHVRDYLARAAADAPAAERLLVYAHSLQEILPPDAAQRLKLLGEIRALIDDSLRRFGSRIADEDRRLLAKLRPPDTLRELHPADLPEPILAPFRETDGALGRIVIAATDQRFDHWNVSDVVQFVRIFRTLDLPATAQVGGQAFVFSDILGSMKRDGPLASLLALLGSVSAVFLVVGTRWHGLVTLASTALGVVSMIAMASLLGVKVNFLDFIALPITIGIGIDYAANMAARDQQDRPRDPRHLLATTGGAVLLCSLTTTIGYGSLLLSDNAGIRSFGLTAMVGEVTCVAAALFWAGACFGWLRARGAIQ